VEADAVLRVSARTRTRWKERSRIDPDSSDKLARLARIYTLALDVLEKPEIAVAWMRESVAGLGGTRPIEAIATDAGAEQVSNLLHQMEYGIYA
jgi:putative toxin-antitoxin system antitoxin component (TIGR02293 family)